MNLTNYEVALQNAIYIDVNTLLSVNKNPDRLPDALSVSDCSLINLLNCPIGGRGRTFEPTYGTIHYQLLQEPIDQHTADSINIGLLQAIQKWEPRITVDRSNTWVQPNTTLPGYIIRLTFSVNITGQRVSTDYVLRTSNGN